MNMHHRLNKLETLANGVHPPQRGRSLQGWPLEDALNAVSNAVAKEDEEAFERLLQAVDDTLDQPRLRNSRTSAAMIA